MGKVEFNKELCKGCGYCIDFCPKHLISWSGDNNSSGYQYPVQNAEGCTACGICSRMCPDCAITVFKGED